jgi:cytochrome b subunit of formate dehydrogenase
MAVTHRESLRAIFTGWVSEQWAKVHAATWLEEQRLPREAGEPTAPR